MNAFASRQNNSYKPQPSGGSLNPALLLQRKCACGGSPGLAGECEACKKKRLQKKLSIGTSNDPLEQEADRVAEQVLSAPAHSAVSTTPPRIQRYTGQTTSDAGTAPASVDRALSGSGRPVDTALQQDMGNRFGYDFSTVRVHTGSAAEQSARDVNAHAYTVGNNIVFGAGQFAPESHAGRRLIAHELTHVVQQSGQLAQLQKQHAPPIPDDSCTYAGEAVKQREIHLNLGLSAVRVYTNDGGHEQFNNLITGPSTSSLARSNGWCHMYSVKGHQRRSSKGLINFVNYCGNFGFHSNFWHHGGSIVRIPGTQSHGCARLHDADAASTDSGDSRRFYNLVQNGDCVRMYDRSSWRQPTFKRCPSAGETC